MFEHMCISKALLQRVLSSTKAGPIKEISLGDWMKGEGTESMTVKRERGRVRE